MHRSRSILCFPPWMANAWIVSTFLRRLSRKTTIIHGSWWHWASVQLRTVGIWVIITVQSCCLWNYRTTGGVRWTTVWREVIPSLSLRREVTLTNSYIMWIIVWSLGLRIKLMSTEIKDERIKNMHPISRIHDKNHS